MADSLTTVRPSGIWAQWSGVAWGHASDNWVATGAASLNAALSDDLDTTYMSTVNSIGTHAVSVFFNLPTFAIPASSLVKSVGIRLRCKATAMNHFYMAICDKRKGLPVWGIWQNITTWTYWTASPYNSIVNLATPIYKSPLIGTWHDQSLMNNLALAVVVNAKDYNSAVTGYVYEAYVDIRYNYQPTVTPIGPTGTLTDTTSPLFTWTYADVEGDAMGGYELLLYNDDQYTRPGFSPYWGGAVDKPPRYPVLWDAGFDPKVGGKGGAIVRADSQLQYPRRLPNDTYRVFVVAYDKSGSGWRVPYNTSYAEFTINVTGSPVPVVTAQPEDYDIDNSKETARINIAITASAGVSTDRFRLRRSTDGGTTWDDVRGYEDEFANTGGTIHVYDYEAPPNTDTQYQAMGVRTVTGIDYAGAWSASVTAQLPTKRWWLKDPLDSSKNMMVRLNGDSFDISHKKAGGRFYGLGRKNSIAIRDVPRGDEFQVVLRTENGDDYDAIMAMLDNIDHPTLLLQSDMTKQWYIDVASVDESMPFHPNRRTSPLRFLTLDIIETDAP